MKNSLLNKVISLLSIELGSTRIKAVLITSDGTIFVATGGADWENRLIEGVWTYHQHEIWEKLQAAYVDLSKTVKPSSHHNSYCKSTPGIRRQ